MAQSFIQRLVRQKHIDLSTVGETKLSRCLSTLDLTALGIGSTLGAGIYVVAGQVAQNTAGPSVVLSFLIAAIASVMAGLCYAEFGARVPKTGSAYVYSYYTVGELWAFIIGWNLILEYVIGTASVARAWSGYFDSLISKEKLIQSFFNRTMHMDVPGISNYPDFFALAITLLLSVVLAIGVKESSIINNIFTALNLLVVIYVIITGSFKADIKNWELAKSTIPEGSGSGGFLPFGFSGMMSGAATCFYAFVGFDCIATTGEEVRNPQRAIPISIVVSLLACALAYCGISAVITLMVPYYTLDHDAPLPIVFEHVGWDVAKYIISVGAICGLSTSLLGAMFPMPRVIYAMASDGLIFRFLAHISERFKTPLRATIVSGILSGLMAMLFDLKELVDMMSIGTLMAYTLVGACVLILRYKPDKDGEDGEQTLGEVRSGWEYSSTLSVKQVFWEAFNPSSGNTPTKLSAKIVSVTTLIIGIVITVLCAVIILEQDDLVSGEWWAILQVALVVCILVVFVAVIVRQPQNKKCITFLVPGLPFLPVFSMFINIYLMMKLSSATWIRFGVWMAIGFVIYFAYGIRHSSEEQRSRDASITSVILNDSSDNERQEAAEKTHLIAD